MPYTSKTTRRILVGNVPIGGGAPVSVQSMTNTDTRDVEATLGQIRALQGAGCQIVRVSVFDRACARAVRALAEQSPLPVVADIHFDYELAVLALENGAHKLRVNPGNMGGGVRVDRLTDALRRHPGVPVRVGVNCGSLSAETLERFGGPTPEALADSAWGHIRLLEQRGFCDICVSLKASGVRDTVAAYRRMAEGCPYPLHIGVTEAGTPHMGLVKSAAALGALLLDGIGDTMRVSLAGDPALEVRAALDILRAVGLRRDRVNVIACPTCARTQIDVIGIAEAVEAYCRDLPADLTVAVMGCVVNGPGEARQADIGIAGGGRGKGVLFEKGREPVPLPADRLLPELLRRIDEMCPKGDV